LFALNAAYAFVRREIEPHLYWVLGDVIGRGPLPVQTWLTVYEDIQPDVWLAGNHDWYVVPQDLTNRSGAARLRGPLFEAESGLQVDGPNLDAWAVALRHRNDCPDPILEHLAGLQTAFQVHPNVYLAHGVYQLPTFDDQRCLETYLLSYSDLEGYLSHPEAPWREGNPDLPFLHIAGHTHFRELWERPHLDLNEAVEWQVFDNHQDPHPQINVAYPLRPGHFYHINPGSVGFPRNGGCSEIAVLDTDPWQITFYKIPYDSEAVRREMRNLGYPPDSYNEVQLRPCQQNIPTSTPQGATAHEA
jgi:hypothetical protein